MYSSGNMYSGTVRNWFDSSHAKGYGFIIPDIDGEDVFVHRQNVMNATYLTTGDTVTYKLQVNQLRNKSKLQAVKVWVTEFTPDRVSAGGSVQPYSSQSWASGSNQWGASRASWDLAWQPHEWHSEQTSGPGSQPEGVVTVREGLSLDTVTFSAVESSLREEELVENDYVSAAAPSQLPSGPLPNGVVDAAVQTDICMPTMANKDTQYPEFKSPPANPKRSTCSLVNIPLKSPPVHLRLSPQESQIVSLAVQDSGPTSMQEVIQDGPCLSCPPPSVSDEPAGLQVYGCGAGNQRDEQCERDQPPASPTLNVPFEEAVPLPFTCSVEPVASSTATCPVSPTVPLNSLAPLPSILEEHPEADMGPEPVMLPIKQPPPGRSYPSTVGVGVLSAAEQFEMQAAFAYTAALAKQVPVPKGLYAYNLARAKALLPPRWEALGLEQGQLYFSDTVRGYTTFSFPDRPAGAEPSVIAKTRGSGHIQLK